MSVSSLGRSVTLLDSRVGRASCRDWVAMSVPAAEATRSSAVTGICFSFSTTCLESGGEFVNFVSCSSHRDSEELELLELYSSYGRPPLKKNDLY